MSCGGISSRPTYGASGRLCPRCGPNCQVKDEQIWTGAIFRAIETSMKINMQILSAPDPNRTKRDVNARVTFDAAPPGDYTVACPACDIDLYPNVSLDYVKSLRADDSKFVCSACGAVFH